MEHAMEHAMPVASPRSVEAQLEVVPDEECLTLLRLGDIGRIAFVLEGLPIILPVNYRVVSDDAGMWIMLRTRPGNSIDRAPEHVAFETDGIDHERQRGWSVLVRGAIHHMDHNEVELFNRRYDPKPWPQSERTSWLAIKPQTITGRRLESPNHEWTFPSRA